MSHTFHFYYWGDVVYANMTNLFFDNCQYSQGFPLNQNGNSKHILKYILKV